MATPVVDRLRTDVLAGVFSPGEHLVELQLCDRYDCGRAFVRAALIQLETEGLITRNANRGASVRRISTAEAIEITEARAALESLVAGRAAQKATEDDAKRLAAIVAEMRAAVAADDAITYAGLNRRLHELLLTIGGHSVAADLVLNLRNRAVQNQFRLAMIPGRQAVSLRQHAAIVEAVAAGDEPAAAAAMHEHLRSVIDVLGRWEDPR